MKVDPVKLTPEVSQKLEQAAAMDATWEECSLFAGISPATLYNWMESIDGLRERLEALRARPLLKARQTIVDALDDPRHAQWYVERKAKKEFGSNIDVTTDGKALESSPAAYDTPKIAALVREYEDKLKGEVADK